MSFPLFEAFPRFSFLFVFQEFLFLFSLPFSGTQALYSKAESSIFDFPLLFWVASSKLNHYSSLQVVKHAPSSNNILLVELVISII